MDEIKELKSQAYDILAQIEYLQKVLIEINAKISQLSKKEQKTH